MKTVAVIPTYNGERTITQVVKETKKYCDEVIVVDDCSLDNTPKIIQRLGVKYALCGKNHGQGSATRIGMRMALEFGADIIVTLDSDGQHNPNEIPQVLKPILEGRADLAIGSRFMPRIVEAKRREDYLFDASYAQSTYYFEKREYEASLGEIPRYRKFGIDIINWLYNVCNSKKLIDTQSCFRAYTRRLVEKLTIKEDGFGFSTETLIKARKMGARMVEIPVSCIYHKLKQDSTMNPLKHGLMVAWKTLWWRIKLWD